METWPQAGYQPSQKAYLNKVKSQYQHPPIGFTVVLLTLFGVGFFKNVPIKPPAALLSGSPAWENFCQAASCQGQRKQGPLGGPLAQNVFLF